MRLLPHPHSHFGEHTHDDDDSFLPIFASSPPAPNKHPTTLLPAATEKGRGEGGGREGEREKLTKIGLDRGMKRLRRRRNVKIRGLWRRLFPSFQKCGCGGGGGWRRRGGWVSIIPSFKRQRCRPDPPVHKYEKTVMAASAAASDGLDPCQNITKRSLVWGK